MNTGDGEDMDWGVYAPVVVAVCPICGAMVRNEEGQRAKHQEWHLTMLSDGS